MWGNSGYGVEQQRPVNFPHVVVVAPNGNGNGNGSTPEKSPCGCRDKNVDPVAVENANGNVTTEAPPTTPQEKVIVEARPIHHQIFIGVVVGIILFFLLRKRPTGIV
jgi:hypothetical protein